MACICQVMDAPRKLLSSQEARVAFSYHLVPLLCFFCFASSLMMITIIIIIIIIITTNYNNNNNTVIKESVVCLLLRYDWEEHLRTGEIHGFMKIKNLSVWWLAEMESQTSLSWRNKHNDDYDSSSLFPLKHPKNVIRDLFLWITVFLKWGIATSNWKWIHSSRAILWAYLKLA